MPDLLHQRISVPLGDTTVLQTAQPLALRTWIFTRGAANAQLICKAVYRGGAISDFYICGTYGEVLLSNVDELNAEAHASDIRTYTFSASKPPGGWVNVDSFTSYVHRGHTNLLFENGYADPAHPRRFRDCLLYTSGGAGQVMVAGKNAASPSPTTIDFSGNVEIILLRNISSLKVQAHAGSDLEVIGMKFPVGTFTIGNSTFEYDYS